MLTTLFSLTSYQLTYGYTAQIYTLAIENQLKSEVKVKATYDHDKGMLSSTTETIIPAQSTVHVVHRGNNPYAVTLQKISFSTTGADGIIIGQEIQDFDPNKQKVKLAPQHVSVSSGFRLYVY